MIIRTLQIGLALIVISIVVLGVLMIIGVMTYEAALTTGLNVTMVIALCMAAGAALAVVLGIRGNGGQ